MLLPADTQHTHAQTQHGDSHSFSAIMWCCHGEGGLRHNSAIVLRGRGGPIRETDCSLTVTLPALMPTALPPTETQTHPLAEGPACTGPYRHGNQSRLQCIFHTLHPPHVDTTKTKVMSGLLLENVNSLLNSLSTWENINTSISRTSFCVALWGSS